MKTLIHSLTLATAIGSFLAPASAFAGPCCTKAVSDAKRGKVCEHTLATECCKQSVRKANVATNGKKCEICQAKKKAD